MTVGASNPINMDPKLRQVLENLAANLGELTALLELHKAPDAPDEPFTSPSSHLRPSSTWTTASDTEVERATEDHQPTVGHLLLQSAPTSARLSSLPVAWSDLRGGLEAPNCLDRCCPPPKPSGATATGDNRVPKFLSTGFGRIKEDCDDVVFLWDLNRPDSLLGAAYSQGSDGYPLCTQLNNSTVSLV